MLPGCCRLPATDATLLARSKIRSLTVFFHPTIRVPLNVYHFDHLGALLHTDLPLPKRSGKVRDVYDLGDRYAIISTDRISAFDYILPSGIPDKGRILTAMSEFWFTQLQSIEHHWLSSRIPEDLLPASIDPEPLYGRTMIVRKANVVPFECIVRGYIEGSGLAEYRRSGQICGIEPACRVGPVRSIA